MNDYNLGSKIQFFIIKFIFLKKMKLENVEDNKNRFTHLTNACVQKNHPNF